MSIIRNHAAFMADGRRFGSKVLLAAAASLALLVGGCVVVDDNDRHYGRGKKGFHGHHHHDGHGFGHGHRREWNRGRH